MISKTSIYIAILLSMICLSCAHAWELNDLFTNSDQKGARLLDINPVSAAEKFKNVSWKGVAYYRSGDYKRAIGAFSSNQTELNLYNRSLAYARIGEFDRAIEDLDRVLAVHPENEKASDNREIFKNLKKQQKRSQGSKEKPTMIRSIRNKPLCPTTTQGTRFKA